ncbi:MAG TPA: ATP-binding cassette domain-containing protein, partial [Geminicoccaceae bacterium]|nr:ATP-binding cassette domain-containing protein [Geminicoccaceae bacterium]
RAIVELLAARARDDGTAVLLITHDLAAAAPVARRVAVLAGGRIVEDAPTAEILARPRHEAARQLVAASFPATRAGRDRPPPCGARLRDGGNAALLRLDRVCVHARERGGAGSFLRPRRRPILSCVDLIVREGEAVAVTGPSGGGKSTLAAVIAGLLQPSSGRVLFAGRDLLATRRISGPAAGREIQLVFQDHAGSLNPSWRVGAVVAEPLLAHGLAEGRRAARATAAALLERVGLDAALAEALPGELSGGQRQRVALARAGGAAPSDHPRRGHVGPGRDHAGRDPGPAGGGAGHGLRFPARDHARSDRRAPPRGPRPADGRRAADPGRRAILA